MATVATAHTPTPRLRFFQTNPSPESVLPFGDVTFLQAGTIPSLGAGDVNVDTISCVLPNNYFYRIIDIGVTITAAAEADLDDGEMGMAVTVSENQVSLRHFGLYNVSERNGANVAGVSNIAGFQGANPSATNDFFTFFAPDGPSLESMRKTIIDASGASSVVQIVWVNAQPTTAAMTEVPYVRLLMYTIEQGSRSGIWAL